MRVLVAPFAAVLLASGTAPAQPGHVQKADALFREGRALMKAGDLDAACPKLELSYRLDPGVGVAANIGDCFEKQGKVASALLAYRAARKLLRARDPRIGPVEEQIAALEKRAPKLTITLAPDAPEGTKVTRDGKAVDFADFGRPVPMNPGNVVIVVTAPGRADNTVSVELMEGKSRELAVRPGKAVHDIGESEPRRTNAGMAPVQSERASDEGSGQRTVGYALGGIGLAAGLFGGIAFARAHQKEDMSRSKDDSDHSSAKDWETVGIVSLVIGGAGVVSGAVLLIAADSDGLTTESAVRVAPTFDAGAAKFLVQGRW